MTTYFNTTNHLWQEIDLYQDLKMLTRRTLRIARYKRMYLKKEVFDFLSGLNAEFDQPIPWIKEVYSAIRGEESWLMVMMTKENPAKEGLLLKLEIALVCNQWNFSMKNDDKDKLWCDHCNKPCHTMDMCWKLNGKLQGCGRGNNQQAKTAEDFRWLTGRRLNKLLHLNL